MNSVMRQAVKSNGTNGQTFRSLGSRLNADLLSAVTDTMGYE
jgi:hypothetical protein